MSLLHFKILKSQQVKFSKHVEFPIPNSQMASFQNCWVCKYVATLQIFEVPVLKVSMSQKFVSDFLKSPNFKNKVSQFSKTQMIPKFQKIKISSFINIGTHLVRHFVKDFAVSQNNICRKWIGICLDVLKCLAKSKRGLSRFFKVEHAYGTRTWALALFGLIGHKNICPGCSCDIIWPKNMYPGCMFVWYYLALFGTSNWLINN